MKKISEHSIVVILGIVATVFTIWGISLRDILFGFDGGITDPTTNAGTTFTAVTDSTSEIVTLTDGTLQIQLTDIGIEPTDICCCEVNIVIGRCEHTKTISLKFS